MRLGVARVTPTKAAKESVKSPQLLGQQACAYEGADIEAYVGTCGPRHSQRCPEGSARMNEGRHMSLAHRHTSSLQPAQRSLVPTTTRPNPSSRIFRRTCAGRHDCGPAAGTLVHYLLRSRGCLEYDEPFPVSLRKSAEASQRPFSFCTHVL
jgi:hypothetical protein